VWTLSRNIKQIALYYFRLFIYPSYYFCCNINLFSVITSQQIFINVSIVVGRCSWVQLSSVTIFIPETWILFYPYALWYTSIFYGPVHHQIWTSEASVHIIFCWWRTGPYTAIWPSAPWTICYITYKIWMYITMHRGKRESQMFMGSVIKCHYIYSRDMDSLLPLCIVIYIHILYVI
jgi:hypothetical protein